MNFVSFLHVRTATEFTDGIAECIFHGVELCIFHIFALFFLQYLQRPWEADIK